MVYTLHFKKDGKVYSNFEIVPGKFNPNQFEAVTCGLLLWKIEKEDLSRKDFYMDLSLIEYDEENDVRNCVWSAKSYLPISEEVK